MRSQGARGARLTPVDDDTRPRPVADHLEARRYDPLFEEHMLKAQFRRERSSAYWFAASTWGICGLVIGACLGAYMMYVASVATLPMAQDALARGAAMQAARETVDGRAPLMSDRPVNPAQSEP